MVIQRWQSVLLLAAAVMMCCFSFCSLGQVNTTDYSFNFSTLGFTYENGGEAPETMFLSTWYFFVLTLTTALLLLIDIFLYRNLQLQKKICWVGILLIIGSIAVGATLGHTAIEGGTISWSGQICSPLIALIASLMALGRMQSDYNKLRAVDRIR